MSVRLSAKSRKDSDHSRESRDGDWINLERALSALELYSQAFEEPFALVDVNQQKVFHPIPQELDCDLSRHMKELADIARGRKPELIELDALFTILAFPISWRESSSDFVAVGVFVSEEVGSKEELAQTDQDFSIEPHHALRYAKQHEVWTPRNLARMANALHKNLVQQSQLFHLQSEMNQAVMLASDTFSELGLLHRLARHLHEADADQTDTWKKVLTWLSRSIPACCFAVVSNRSLNDDQPNLLFDCADSFLSYGKLPSENFNFGKFIEKLGLTETRQPLILNCDQLSTPDWPASEIGELACIPITVGDSPIGWLLALSYPEHISDEAEYFGNDEIRLLSTVATLVGVHCSSRNHFKEQTELFESSVRALASAIDAKDGFTAGHSDRVAHIAVTIAKQLGLNKEDCKTLYLGGILHDIGKIGIDDQILNKPGDLTDAEYEQVKKHPQLGYDILRNVRQMDKVLPVVLHHHEAWDGNGYPAGLKGTETPLLARIMAVADAYDAMSSDRPYRKGLPEEKIEAIMRDGAGKQWDPQVIEAFFLVRDQIDQFDEIAPRDYPLDAVLA